MKMQGFLLIISKICLTAILSYCTVHAEMMKKKTSTFTIKSGATIMASSDTTDVYSRSQSACASMCLLHDKCCVVSFSEESSICRLNTADNCCAATDNATGSSIMTRNQYSYIYHGDTLFSIYEDQVNWMKAQQNCELCGGKLAELETSEENDFLKKELKNRSTEALGYWIGGYNFHNDDDMEWVGEPNQVMPFSDMAANQPSNPKTELCMMMWKSWDFQWADHSCGSPLSYVCEFMHH